MVKTRVDMAGWNMWEHGVSNSLLTVMEQTEDYISPNGVHLAQWICKCKCGNEHFIAIGSDIRNGHTISCGCLKRERAIKHNIEGKNIIPMTYLENLVLVIHLILINHFILI